MKVIKIQKTSLLSLVFLIFFSINSIVVNATIVSDEEQTFSIEFPSNYTVVDQDSTQNKQEFDQQTLEYFMDYVKSNNLFSLGITADLTNEIEIYIEVSDKNEKTFSRIDDKKLLELGEKTITKLREEISISEDIIFYPLSIYENKSAKFIVFQSKDGGGFLTQFMTIHNSSLYRMSFRNNEVKDNTVAAKKIIDTMVMKIEAKDTNQFSLDMDNLIVSFGTGAIGAFIPGLIWFLYTKRKSKKIDED